MKLQHFNSLKVKDRVYLLHGMEKGKYLSTTVLKIDHFFKKITVLLGKKPYSYKYIQKEVPIEKQSSHMVRMCENYQMESKSKTLFY